MMNMQNAAAAFGAAAVLFFVMFVVLAVKLRRLRATIEDELSNYVRTLTLYRDTDRARLASYIRVSRERDAVRSVAEIRGNLVERLRAEAVKAEGDADRLREQWALERKDADSWNKIACEQVRELTELRAALAKAPIDLEALKRLEPGPLVAAPLKRATASKKRRWKARKR